MMGTSVVNPEDANRGRAMYALIALLLAYILSFIDRNVMAVLIGPIRADFAIRDFQYSLLHGFAYCAIGGQGKSQMGDYHRGSFLESNDLPMRDNTQFQHSFCCPCRCGYWRSRAVTARLQFAQ